MLANPESRRVWLARIFYLNAVTCLPAMRLAADIGALRQWSILGGVALLSIVMGSFEVLKQFEKTQGNVKI